MSPCYMPYDCAIFFSSTADNEFPSQLLMGRDVTLPCLKNVLLNLTLSLWSLRCQVWIPRIIQRCVWTMRLKHSCGCLCSCCFQAWPCTLWEHKPSMTFPVLLVVSSFTSLGWCSIWISLPLYFRLGWYTIWQDMEYDFLSATKGPVEEKHRSSESYLSRRRILTTEKWERTKINYLSFLVHVDFYKCSSSLQTHQEKTFMPTEHACWAACDIFMLSEVGFSS